MLFKCSLNVDFCFFFPLLTMRFWRWIVKVYLCPKLCFLMQNCLSLQADLMPEMTITLTKLFWMKICIKVNKFEELTHWKRLWCWDWLGAGGKGYDRGWDGWMASPTWWMWVWVNSGSWWWTGRPGVLGFMGLQRVGHDWVTVLNWTERVWSIIHCCIPWI